MSDNNQEQQMKTLADEVLRKIGRNLIQFQQIEVMLKYLVANSRFEGDTSNLVDRHQKKTEKVQKQMLGELVKQYVGDVLKDAGEPIEEPEVVKIPYLITTFTTSSTQEFYESQTADMKLMVDERNELIHHFLPRWQPQTIASLKEASDYLDAQSEKVRPMYDHLDSVIISRKKVAQYLSSEDFHKIFELEWLQKSQIIHFMKEVTAEIRRADGWTYLANAGQIAKEKILEDVVRMEECYGHKTFKQLLLASELFDVLDEPLPNGKYRTVYRVRKIVAH